LCRDHFQSLEKTNLMNTISFSAPGSLMLLGEHAVLHGKLAVVCAVNRRARVTLAGRDDRKILISSALGDHETDLDSLAMNSKLKFVMAAILEYRGRFKTGFALEFRSEFSHTIGFGSSATITVITHAAIRQWLGDADDKHTLFDAARKTIRDVQGAGSGADVAASVFGGVVGYRAEPLEFFPFAVSRPLTAVYSGSKMPTPEVIAIVEARRKKEPEKFDAIFSAMERTSCDAMDALKTEDWQRVGVILNEAQSLMEAIGVSNEALAEIVRDLRADPGILGAKISGSGLGDCAVGLGRARENLRVGATFAVDIDPCGVREEKNL
jgi:mevalonate kinase